ncbi:MAG: CAAX prenyl protease-related protein, partial [Massilia sp.]
DAASAAPPASLLNRASWARILPFATYMLFVFVLDMLERAGLDPSGLRWLYGVKIAAVSLVLAACWRQYDELRAPRMAPAAALSAIAVGLLVLLLWVSLKADWMIIGHASGFNPLNEGRLDWTLIAMRIAGAALVVPVMEELFWRSFLMRWIVAAEFQAVEPSQASIKSFVFTSVLFGFEHNLWLAGIVAGAAYCGLYMRHRTLWSPILAHAVTNGCLAAWVVWTGNWSYW